MFEFKSVSELNNYTKDLISTDSRLRLFMLEAEISACKSYPSGLYFSLKDEYSIISCVMFNYSLASLDFTPKIGDKVLVVAKADFYKNKGTFQIVVSSMKKSGKGTLEEEFKKLYNKLMAEGLYDDAHKKPIPKFPRRIGIITSPQGAVIHDIISTLRKRNDNFDILLYPSAVQGDSASNDIIEGIKYFNNSSNVDVIIICRGGGSREDLWCYNNEALAYEIYDSTIPIISGVGHEVDYTICDYVSDLRVPTPTAAAMRVLISKDELLSEIISIRRDMSYHMLMSLKEKRDELSRISNLEALRSPLSYIDRKKQEFIKANESFHETFNKYFDEKRNDLSNSRNTLMLLNPLEILKRGYSVVRIDNRVVSSVHDFTPGQKIEVVLNDGRINALVEGDT